ncbi:hypothetical protein EN933_06430 [Mesorhizobium sp. M7A.F.Ca.US.001.01.1.1]|nr:hypothetical protein EN933_06430 [Mesorhizobium sp. M7A.F.Ca.US.001.01.1.1]
MTSSRRILYLDQNAWIALAKGAWDATVHPKHHAALACIIEASKADRIIVPLSFTNIYETVKINDPVRRVHLARVQSTISGGWVIRGRRRILTETLVQHIAGRLSLDVPPLPDGWFLSDFWFEAAADYMPEQYGFEISERILGLVRQNPAFALFNYLTEADNDVRAEAVRMYTASSTELIAKLEARRKIVAGETFAVRRRAYSARLLLDEIDFIFVIAKQLNLSWSNVHDIGPSLAKSLIADVPIMNVERELVVRLEDQNRITDENDLRDVASFTTALPLADVFVAEKPFVNLARQARLGDKYGTVLLTSVTELTGDML